MTIVFVGRLIARTWPLHGLRTLCEAVEIPFEQLAPCILSGRFLAALRFLKSEIYHLVLLTDAGVVFRLIPVTLKFVGF